MTRVAPRPASGATVANGDVDAVVRWLERTGTEAARVSMARYAIPADNAFGIAVGTLQREANQRIRNRSVGAVFA